MDVEECLQPVLTSQEVDNFHKLKTLPIVVTASLLLIALQIAGYLFGALWDVEQNKCDSYFIVLYLRCANWLVVLLVDHLVKMHHCNLRISGYLEFYVSTYRIIRRPLFIASLSIMAYLLLTAVLFHTQILSCVDSKILNCLNLMLVVSTAEYLGIFGAYNDYIKRVKQFNRLRPPPDVTREEWLSSFTDGSYAGSGVAGHHEWDFNLAELLEKQAGFIRYLLDRNVKLSQQTMLQAGERRAVVADA